jgi:hypothetical protein
MLDVAMNDEVMLVVDEICEELIGYIGEWLDEKPDFSVSEAENVMDEIYCRLKMYIKDKE